ncbi:hypothetical protein [Pseudoalteromonas ruthenica]|uniref:RiboL-PSP-HEPN domain-containing protein n=1 Tax=Pseudoalteromonas ruthenica TaxID=151081 RepID=A0A0F4PZY9_9GAMM|nr:hypothetical protein [Pseudoalteromonas ruthenica]KJY99081.1 hypothetical protein TW76_05235 [Pseudoalteromonas ruthenica]KJY99876.1 hypothetical protein TW72_09660 [Pseudoalteromonas ruthenica]TMO83667.1 hypothetical protein CWC12_19420 [Pseudoalteromonas ruthenica]TMO92914.1 hypothetical protein CWC13_07175 [Pseudoalteromonas ruthenica]TMP00596.1 hypothetical protein CWC07_05180 [Pseudoalteromonas ruthenica]
MSSVKEYLFEIQNERADEWIRERLSDAQLDEDSEEWQQLASEYSNYQDHLLEEAEWEAELKWLKENGSSNIHRFFVDELNALKTMAESNLGHSTKMAFMLHSNIVVKMSYAYAVTLLESFLGDTLKALITEREDFLHNAIRNVEEVSKAKYSLAELAETDLNICNLAVKHATEILFHNIPKVKKVYEQVLGVKLQLDISKVSKITALRHDIVHRNGYSKDNEPINLNAQDLYQAIEDIREFTSSLQKQINAL